MQNLKNIKLAIVCSHPIQYYVPVFEMLAKKVTLKVFYTVNKKDNYDPGFRKMIIWDIPLLSGYNYQFVSQTSIAIYEISTFNPDFLLVYGWFHYSHVQILRYFRNKIPILFRGDSTLLNKGWFPKNILKSVILNFIYKHVDYAFYVGTNNKAYFLKYGLKEAQLSFVPHSIDNKRFSDPHSLNIREKLSIKTSDIVILYAGKFEQIKNLMLLIDAFIDIKANNTHLLLVGEGPLASKLKTKCKKNINIHFMNFQNQSVMPAIYQACDLYCLPSYSESWGLSINEAMAASKAILASDKVGSAIDLIKENNGSIFKSDCIEDLKDKLKALLRSKTELQEKGRASYSIIQLSSIETQVNKILSVIG